MKDGQLFFRLADGDRVHPDFTLQSHAQKRAACIASQIRDNGFIQLWTSARCFFVATNCRNRSDLHLFSEQILFQIWKYRGDMIVDIPVLTMEMVTVFAVLGLVVILLVFDLLRVDVVGLLVMTLLPLTGILSAGEAVAGLGSSAVVEIGRASCRERV